MKGETTTGGFLDHDDQIQLVDTALKHGFLGAEHAPEGIHRGGITAADLQVVSGGC